MATDLDVSGDLWVAAAAAGCTVALSLVFRFGLGLDVPLVSRLAPLFPYLAYIFTRRGVSLGALDTVRNWILLTVVVTVATLLFYAV